jgi:hypothetical protein
VSAAYARGVKGFTTRLVMAPGCKLVLGGFAVVR